MQGGHQVAKNVISSVLPVKSVLLMVVPVTAFGRLKEGILVAAVAELNARSRQMVVTSVILPKRLRKIIFMYVAPDSVNKGCFIYIP
jgi:hypothetical protein